MQKFTKSQPEIGDTIVIKGEVTDFGRADPTVIFYRILGEDGIRLTKLSRIAEIIPKPCEPKIGDQVWWVSTDGKRHTNSDCMPSGATLLFIHQKDDERKFAVVAYEGDIPKSIWFHNLRKTYIECAAS